MVELLTPLASALNHPSPRVIRPLRTGDIISFPHLSAIGHYDGTLGFDDFEAAVEWAIPPDGPQGALPQSSDEADTMLDSGELVILESGFSSIAAWSAYQTYRDTDPRLTTPGGAPSTSQLSLRAERGTGAKRRVNGFLKHPTVQYQHDPVARTFNITLTATYSGRDVAMAVLGRPSGRHNADGRTIELHRFAAHPDRPANTGSWLLSRCCAWSRLEGYDRLLTYAGVENDNEGTMYQAAGFDHLGTTTANRDQWHSRSNRTGGGTYTKRRYQRTLTDHPLEARRTPGRVDVDQTRLGEAARATSGPASQADLIQTREEIPDARGGSLPATTREFVDEHGAVESRVFENSPLVACFGYRTPQDRLVAALCLRDTIGQPNPRDTREPLTLATLGVETDALTYPVNVVRALIADAVEWTRLHGYHGVENQLSGSLAAAATNGLEQELQHTPTSKCNTAGEERSPTITA